MTMKKIMVIMMALLVFKVNAQELYVYSEPASNMPARSLGTKYIGRYQKSENGQGVDQRQEVELMFGLNKKWMLHTTTSFSDMYTSNTRWESVRAYAKYRFLSVDEVHRHFRMAAFGEISHSRNRPRYDELSLTGDQSGVGGGLILTQLLHKLAVSSTLGIVQSLQKERLREADKSLYSFNAFNYSLSAGYLLLPRTYKNYQQTNFNVYVELMGSRSLDKNLQYLDIAPALQLIFNSNTKLNLGYRFQLSGNMNRMATQSLQVSIERTFLNALKKKD